MKKQVKRLNLSKKTISNLQPSQMGKLVGGYWTALCHGGYHTNGCTKNCTQNGGNTCADHNTCYNC